MKRNAYSTLNEYASHLAMDPEARLARVEASLRAALAVIETLQQRVFALENAQADGLYHLAQRRVVAMPEVFEIEAAAHESFAKDTPMMMGNPIFSRMPELPIPKIKLKSFHDEYEERSPITNFSAALKKAVDEA